MNERGTIYSKKKNLKGLVLSFKCLYICAQKVQKTY